MKILIAPSALLFALLLLVSPPAKAEVSFEVFYDNLAPYGDWIYVGNYGYCWRPTQIVAGWRPYTRGSWAWTNQGWCWVSNEPWGWATYHYGRWTFLRSYGWIWVPGYVWAPAWVSWRECPSYIGWAPLPPSVGWSVSVGIRFGFGGFYDCGPDYYSFVPIRYFGARRLWNYCLPVAQNTTIIQNTTNITNITNVTNNNQTFIYNRGPDYRRVAENSSSRVPRYTIDAMSARDIEGRRDLRPQARGNILRVAAPEVAPAGGDAPRPRNVRGRISNASEDPGFNSAGGRGGREQVTRLYRDQAQSVRRAGNVPQRLPSARAPRGDNQTPVVSNAGRRGGETGRVSRPQPLGEPVASGNARSAGQSASPARSSLQPFPNPPDSQAAADRGTSRTTPAQRTSRPDPGARAGSPTAAPSTPAQSVTARTPRRIERPATTPVAQPTREQRPARALQRQQAAAPAQVQQQRPQTARSQGVRQRLQQPAAAPAQVQQQRPQTARPQGVRQRLQQPAAASSSVQSGERPAARSRNAGQNFQAPAALSGSAGRPAARQPVQQRSAPQARPSSPAMTPDQRPARGSGRRGN